MQEGETRGVAGSPSHPAASRDFALEVIIIMSRLSVTKSEGGKGEEEEEEEEAELLTGPQGVAAGVWARENGRRNQGKSGVGSPPPRQGEARSRRKRGARRLSFDYTMKLSVSSM